MPPNKLKKAVEKVKPGTKIEFDPVARAEAALAELADDFAVWMDEECARLDTARNAIKASGITPGNQRRLFHAAHDIKGQAATFGFPLVAPVADSLCRLIEHTPDISRSRCGWSISMSTPSAPSSTGIRAATSARCAASWPKAASGHRRIPARTRTATGRISWN